MKPTCPRAEPPKRVLWPLAKSTSTSLPLLFASFRSGVTVLVMSGQVTYALMTRLPGAMTVSPPADAVIDRLSLPPSHATCRHMTQAQNHMGPAFNRSFWAPYTCIPGSAWFVRLKVCALDTVQTCANFLRQLTPLTRACHQHSLCDEAA